MKNKLEKIFLYFIVPLLLLVLIIWSIFGYLKKEEFGVMSLDIRGKQSELVATQSGELIAGDIIWGKFNSKYPNLGILSVRFHNQDRDSDDTLVFRLKEQGTDNWLYEADYKTDQFLPHKHFPFGFPIIVDSKDKNYEFQLESLRGATDSGIIIDKTNPVFIARSIFTKTELLGDKSKFGSFLINKFFNIFGDRNILTNVFCYFLPLIFYLLFLLSKGISYQILTSIAFLFTLYDSFFLVKSYDFLFLSVLFLWGLISNRFKFESRIAGVFALGYLVLTPILLVFGRDAQAEKTAVWAYLFLCITVAQQIYELKYKGKHLFTLNNFVKELKIITIADNSLVLRIPKRVIDVTGLMISALIASFVIKNIWNGFLEFVEYYPTDFFSRFIKTLIIPEIFVLSVMGFILYKIGLKSRNLILSILILTLLFSAISKKLVSISIGFQSQPRIHSVSPNTVTEAWTDVVITGKNFRDIPFIGKLYIDDVEQGEYMVYWSDEKIIFRTSPDLTKSGPIRVVPMDRSPSNKVPFKYTFE